MANTDLDILLPEDEVIEFTAKDDKRYSIRLFVPFAVGAYIIDHADELAEVFPNGGRPKLSRKTLDLVLKVFSMVCREQYDHMTEDWIKANISLPRQIAIIIKIATPVYQFISGMGFLEAALPVKEPEDAS